MTRQQEIFFARVAGSYSEGDDPQLQEARQRMPEPARYDGAFYNIIVRPPEPVDWDSADMAAAIKLDLGKRIMFTKVLAHMSGVVCYAWYYDGKIYL